MSSPVAKRRNIGKIIDDTGDSDDEFADVSMIDKENVNALSPSKSPSSPKERRASTLAPLDQNLDIEAVRLEPPSSLAPPESPKQKTSFNGPDIIQLSPIKNSKATALSHYTQSKSKKPITRLAIDKLVLTNFKSYAGVQTIGPFHTSFSAVVGPNGSGKSNVIDSMLFVFGFRANKMRQGKLSELIHNSEAAPNLASCSVDIHFLHVTDNLDDTTTIVPESRLVISRKAFRNNSSKYYIDGKESNYTEVTNLLKGKGIDLDHKRFLILQGEVESIAQMKPKAEKENDEGLLEYLEDIIGTTSYKSAIEDSYKQIEELNEVCQEKENRFGLVEKEKNSLEGQKDEALAFLSKEKEFTETKSKFLQYNISKSKEQIEINTKIWEDLEAKLKTEKTETSAFEKEVKDLENEHNKLLKSIDEISTQIRKLQESQKKGDRERVAFEEKKKSMVTKKGKSQKLLEVAIHALNESQSKLKNITEENETNDTELASLRQSLVDEKAILDEIRTELTDKTKGFTEQITVYEKKLQPWSELLEQKKSEIKLAETRIQMLNEQKSEIDKDIVNIRQRIEDIGDEINKNERAISILAKEKAHNSEQIRMGDEECAHSSAKLKEMNNILSNQRQKTIEARGSLSVVENKNKVLQSLIRLQDTGRVTGFYGRLGDLGYIDDKYDVAISTACGQLDDMVVDTVETGQQCIEYLRKNNLGYARFILLTKLRKFKMSPINTPRNVPRLFDLVKPKDPKFAPAFYSVLQDTLVASNLSEANQVAYGSKRYRVVTLDGKLIDKSGTLSGGGNHVSRGGMKSTSSEGAVSEREVLQMERDLSQKEASYEIAQNTLYEMNNALKELNERQPEIDRESSKLTFEIESLRNELKNANIRLQESVVHAKRLDTDNKDIKEAEEHAKKLTNEYLELKEQSKELQNKINDLQERIMEIGGVKLRLQKSKVDGINEKIELSQQKLNHNKISLKKLQNELKRYNKSKIEKEKEIESFSEELEKIEKDFEQRLLAIENIEIELNDLINAREDNNAKVESSKIELDEKQEKINELRSAEIELSSKIERHQGIVKQQSRNLDHDMNDLNSLEIKDQTQLLDFLESEDVLKYTKPQVSELSPDEIKGINIEEIEEKLQELEDYMSKAKVDVDILEEYGRRAVEYSSRKIDLNEAVNKRDDIKRLNEELKKKRLDEFMEGFNIISATLKEMYQMITMGGNAELELVDSLDPFSEGILFSVMPPKKSWKNISNLSGGEKTLSSLALVFALHRYKPTPLYVMDEIDAALDFRNVSIVANYIKERTKNAQFVVISLRNNMFELAQQLVGIYKVNNMTRSITLQNKDLLERE